MSSRRLAALLALAAGCLLAWAWLAPRPLPEARLARARLLHQAGRNDRALELAQVELETRPGTQVARLLSDIAMEEPFFVLPGLQARLVEGAREPGPRRDASLYALALIAAKTGNLRDSLALFQQLGEPRQPFVAHSYALVLSRLGELGPAEELWRTEVSLPGGFLESAVPSLADLLRDKGDLASLAGLGGDPRTGPWLRADQHLWLILHGRPALGNLGRALVQRWLKHTAIAWVGALAIALLWIYLLWRLDVFETEPVWALATVFMGGCVATLLLNDLLYGFLDLVHPDPPATQDVFRFIFHTGLAEELTKLVPVALFACLSRQINEPFDYLIYGSLSALGFATLENAFYFDAWPGQDTMLARFISCVVLHLFGTTTVCFAWAWARQRGRNRWVWGLVAFAGACVAHGLYDAAGIPLKQVQVVLEAFGLRLMYARALSWSPFLRADPELPRRWVNSAAIEAGALLMVLLPFLDRQLHTATELAWYGLSTTATLTNLSLLAAVFVPLEVMGLQTHGLLPRVDLAGSLARNLLWLWGSLTIFSEALPFGLAPLGWALSAGMVLLAARLAPAPCRGEAARRRQRRFACMRNLLGGWYPSSPEPPLADWISLGFERVEAPLLPADAHARRQLTALARRGPVVAVLTSGRTWLWTPLEDGRELFTGPSARLEVPGQVVQVRRGASPAALVAAHEEALAGIAAPLFPEDLVARYQESLQRARDSFAVAPVLRTLQLGWATGRVRGAPGAGERSFGS